jgi:hypothetical protein
VTTQQILDSIELMDAVQVGFDCSDLENAMGERRKDALRVILIAIFVTHRYEKDGEA